MGRGPAPGRGRVRATTAAAAALLALAPVTARAAGPWPTAVEAVTASAAGGGALGSAAPRARPSQIGDFLTVVNEARADVGVPPLVWDESVAAHARRWARVRVADCELIHSNSRYGENLAKGSHPRYSLADAARLWLDERDDYDRPSNACVNDRECLHYTQLVWRTSTRVGAAGTRCGNGWTFVVANFDPPGNWLGRRPY